MLLIIEQSESLHSSRASRTSRSQWRACGSLNPTAPFENFHFAAAAAAHSLCPLASIRWIDGSHGFDPPCDDVDAQRGGAEEEGGEGDEGTTVADDDHNRRDRDSPLAAASGLHGCDCTLHCTALDSLPLRHLFAASINSGHFASCRMRAHNHTRLTLTMSPRASAPLLRCPSALPPAAASTPSDAFTITQSQPASPRSSRHLSHLLSLLPAPSRE